MTDQEITRLGDTAAHLAMRACVVFLRARECRPTPATIDHLVAILREETARALEQALDDVRVANTTGLVSPETVFATAMAAAGLTAGQRFAADEASRN